jgi:hypothetical protein
VGRRFELFGDGGSARIERLGESKPPQRWRRVPEPHDAPGYAGGVALSVEDAGGALRPRPQLRAVARDWRAKCVVGFSHVDLDGARSRYVCAADLPGRDGLEADDELSGVRG